MPFMRNNRYLTLTSLLSYHAVMHVFLIAQLCVLLLHLGPL